MSVSYHQKARAAFVEPVTTSRLIIRPWQDGDEKAIADFLNADAGSFPKLYHHYIYDAATRFDEKRVRTEVIPAVRKLQQQHPHFELYIHNRADDRIVGMIEFTQDQLDRDRVSYFVLPSERRHGYALEAYAACVNHAVESGFLAGTLYAHTDPDNKVSQKFLEKAGFQNLGKMTAQNRQKEEITVIGFTRVLSKDQPMPSA